jgi:mRNA interferase MazF
VTSEVETGEWDVIVVPFPYGERLAEKRRPALVVSNERLGGAGVLWIAMITSAGKEKRVGDIAIRHLSEAGLPGASIVRASKLATIEPSRILRRIGRLAKAERSEATRAVAGFLAKA